MSDCARWIALSDREAVGEPVDDAERAFLVHHAEACPACCAERGLFDALERVGHIDAPEPAEPPADLPARAPPRRRRSGLAASVAIFAAAAGLVLWARPSPAPAPAPSPVASPLPVAPVPDAPVPAQAPASVRLGFASGEVTVEGAPGAVGVEVPRGAHVSVGHGAACLVLGSGVRACLASGAHVEVAEDALPDRRLLVTAGRVVAELDPQPPGTSFTLDSRGGAVTAIGTAFSIEVPDGASPVVARVLHGTVLVRPRDAEPRRVSAHAQTLLAPGAVTPLPDADEARDLAVLVPAVSAGDASPAVVRLESDPPGALARIDERVAGRTPLAILLGPGEHAVAVESGGNTLRDVMHLGAGERVERRFDLRGVAARPAQAVAQVQPPADGPPALLRAAREASARGDVAGAAAAYRTLLVRFPSSAEAVAGELSYAELQLGPLGDAPGALRTFDAYLQQGGPLAEEAGYGRARALRALGRAGDERTAIEAFLRDHPGGAAAGALRVRARELGLDP